MASRRGLPVLPDYPPGRPMPPIGAQDSPRSSVSPDVSRVAYDATYYATTGATYPPAIATAGYRPAPSFPISSAVRSESMVFAGGYNMGTSSATYRTAGPSYGSYSNQMSPWEIQGQASPEPYLDDCGPPSSPSDSAFEVSNRSAGIAKTEGKGHSQRRPSNRDEFDGPHQYLQKPALEYIAMQDRELPHLPTNLKVQEQDSVLARVNDILSQSAFDFVAKYQFPIPLDASCRPVERPQDREWTEWVYLLKRLATKRRIPARVLYNGQIKQLVTILENSLEMRHAAKHQSRPLKDDRNILQLISAGIQVARILKDATAFEALDNLYVMTENEIQDRAGNRLR